jgi:hypothetical protein
MDASTEPRAVHTDLLRETVKLFCERLMGE